MRACIRARKRDERMINNTLEDSVALWLFLNAISHLNYYLPELHEGRDVIACPLDFHGEEHNGIAIIWRAQHRGTN